MKTMTHEQIWESRCELEASNALGYLANAIAHQEANGKGCRRGLFEAQMRYFEECLNTLVSIREMNPKDYCFGMYSIED